jgi:phosphoglycerate dehydrogenase-like enzyme
MPTVLISAMTLANVEGQHLDILRDAGFDVIYPARAVQLTEEELLGMLDDVDATLAGSEPYTRRVFDQFPRLRVVARNGVGYDAVDLDAATAHGVAVTTTPGANQESVAEHAFALLLGLARKIPFQDRGVKAGHWPRLTCLPVREQTLGIAGLGRIGKELALRALAFRMKVLAFEKFPDHAFCAAHGVTLVSFDQLLAESDFLSLHLPLTDESRHLIDRRALAKMKPTAFLINTARGGVVCEADLIEALRARRLAGAGLDVFEHEPCLQSPLFEMDEVILSAHVAGADLRSRDEMAQMAARSIVALWRGEWPEGQVVNPQVRAKFRWT